MDNQKTVDYCPSNMFWFENPGIWRTPVVAAEREDPQEVRERAKELGKFLQEISKRRLLSHKS